MVLLSALFNSNYLLINCCFCLFVWLVVCLFGCLFVCSFVCLFVVVVVIVVVVVVVVVIREKRKNPKKKLFLTDFLLSFSFLFFPSQASHRTTRASGLRSLCFSSVESSSICSEESTVRFVYDPFSIYF